MEEKNVNAKCPHCGAELFVSYNQGSGFCTTCKKSFDNAKAVKLYTSLNETQINEEQKKKASYGEEYLEVEKILTRAEFYFERNDYRKAREELEKALEITNSDYRVYFGLVRVETKNLTDYKNTSHKKYLNLALECADTEQKQTITRLYKNFYQLSLLSDEELLQYKKEENVAIKTNLESKLKEIIPVFMKKEKNLKLNVLLACIFGLLAIACAIPGVIFETPVLMVSSVVFFGLTYFFIRKHFTTKQLNALFNGLLDIFDELPNFELCIDDEKTVLEKMKLLRKLFREKNNLNECENEIFNLCAFLTEQTTENARKFILNHPVLCKYTNTNGEN